jgi:hypothetical protein
MCLIGSMIWMDHSAKQWQQLKTIIEKVILMTSLRSAFEHAAFGWIGEPALQLEIYHSSFAGAKPVIMGESPYLNAKPAGMSFALTKKHAVKAVFLYASSIEGFEQYAGGLPVGLTFSSTRDDVKSKIGEAVFSGEAGGIGLMAIEHSFDRFEHGSHYLRFEYMPGNGSIRLVTIGSVDD